MLRLVRSLVSIAICATLAGLGSHALKAQDSLTQRRSADSVRADTVLRLKIASLENQAKQLNQGIAALQRKALVDSLRTLKSDSLAGRVAALELRSIEDNEIAKASVEYRLRVVRTILSEMTKGVTFISFTEDAIHLEQTDQLVTNLWSSEHVRNGWDQLKRWGTVAGAIVAAVAVHEGGEGSDEVAGAGLGLVGLVQIGENLFGKDKSEVVSKVAQQIALSRQAFDELKIRNDELKAFAAKNRSFKARLQAFGATIDTAKVGSDSVQIIVRIEPYLVEYQQIVAQIPSYIQAIIITNKQHIKSYSALQKALEPITTQAEDLLARYNTDVLPILVYANELRTLLDPEVVKALDKKTLVQKDAATTGGQGKPPK